MTLKNYIYIALIVAEVLLVASLNSESFSRAIFSLPLFLSPSLCPQSVCVCVCAEFSSRLRNM